MAEQQGRAEHPSGAEQQDRTQQQQQSFGTSSQRGRRKRGTLLTTSGLQRLEAAIAEREILENSGKPYTLEDLSARSGISLSTLSRVRASRTGVDLRSLRLLFSAFDLVLQPTDYDTLSDEPVAATPSTAIGRSLTLPADPPVPLYPSGPLPLQSPVYIPRPPLEERACCEISQPGCVLRIKGPSGFGKSSLLLRVLHTAQQQDQAIATIHLRQVDPEILRQPHRFLQWFCVAVSLQLGLEPQIQQFWSDLVGDLLSATVYFQESIFPPLQTPLLLDIQELHCLFPYPSTAQTFFPLLRSWHETARHEPVWQNLRLVVAYTTDHYLPLDINQSPFNIGLPINLPEFTLEQVHSLANCYQLSWSLQDCQRLMDLVGGHPELVHTACYAIQYEQLDLKTLIESAPTPQGIYRKHLQKLSTSLEQNPHLKQALKNVLKTSQPQILDPMLAHQLEGVGLIRATSDHQWQIRSELYRLYYQNYEQSDELQN